MKMTRPTPTRAELDFSGRPVVYLEYMLDEKEREEILDKLIAILCEERMSPPPRLKTNNKADCFRALMNVRPPRPVTPEFLALQDAYLSDLAERKGVVDAASLDYTDGMALWQGDITRLKADAIVNACNPALLGCFEPLHNCIDNAIHSAAGVQVRLDCDRIMQGGREPNGCVEVTRGYNLPAKYIFHTVGPVVYGAVDDRCREELKSCYLSCLNEAIRMELETIAFCCISTGVYNFPREEACRIAVETVSRLRKETGCATKAVFNVYLDEDRELYRRALFGKRRDRAAQA